MIVLGAGRPRLLPRLVGRVGVWNRGARVFRFDRWFHCLIRFPSSPGSHLVGTAQGSPPTNAR